MAEPIIFTVDDKEYEVKMSFAGARMAEAQGFNLNEATNQPFTMIPYLLYAGLYATKNRIKAQDAGDLVEKIAESKQYSFGDLTAALIDAYTELFE